MSCVYINTDKFVEAYALTTGKTYSEVFEFIMPRAVKMMTDEVIAAREQGQDIIWDQTSTTVHSRRKKLVMLPDYRKIAVVFATPDAAELSRRLNSRPGKVIPDHVVTHMIENFEQPTLAEGFDQIWMVS
jgi:tRNA uridine 5-carbamoylmethylation protein Kti12